MKRILSPLVVDTCDDSPIFANTWHHPHVNGLLSKPFTAGGFVIQALSCPEMTYSTSRMTTSGIYGLSIGPHFRDVELSLLRGRILGLWVGGVSGSAGFLGVLEDSVPVSPFGCSSYHCSHSASVCFFFFFFFGSHLSPQAPSHQYHSPPSTS